VTTECLCWRLSHPRKKLRGNQRGNHWYSLRKIRLRGKHISVCLVLCFSQSSILPCRPPRKGHRHGERTRPTQYATHWLVTPGPTTDAADAQPMHVDPQSPLIDVSSLPQVMMPGREETCRNHKQEQAIVMPDDALPPRFRSSYLRPETGASSWRQGVGELSPVKFAKLQVGLCDLWIHGNLEV
jgi:hypothetical protein